MSSATNQQIAATASPLVPRSVDSRCHSRDLPVMYVTLRTLNSSFDQEVASVIPNTTARFFETLDYATLLPHFGSWLQSSQHCSRWWPLETNKNVHHASNLRYQWFSHWLERLSGSSAFLPRTPTCCWIQFINGVSNAIHFFIIDGHHLVLNELPMTIFYAHISSKMYFNKSSTTKSTALINFSPL